MNKIKLVTIFLLSFSTLANASPYSKAIRYEEGSNSDYREIYSGVWSVDNINNKNFNSEKSGEEIYPGIWKKEVVNTNETSGKNDNLTSTNTKENSINIVNRGGRDNKDNENRVNTNKNAINNFKPSSNTNKSINIKNNAAIKNNDDDILNILK